MSSKTGAPSNVQGKGYSPLLHSVALSDTSPDPIPIIRKMAAAGEKVSDIAAATDLTVGQVSARIRKYRMVRNRPKGGAHD